MEWILWFAITAALILHGSAASFNYANLRFFADEYQLISIVTVRHPLDSYLGLIAQGWHQQFRPSSLEEICRRSLACLDHYEEVSMRRRREDFLR